MSEEKDETGSSQNVPKKDETKKEDIVISATVDTKQMEEIMGRMKAAELKSTQLAEELKTTTGDKVKLQKEFEDVKTEADDYKSKLSILAKKKLETKKVAIMEEAKKHIKDEDRLKSIADGIKTVEDLKATEFLIETLKTALAEGEKQHKDLQDFETRKKTLKAPDTIKTPEELLEWEKANKVSIDANPTEKPSSGTLTLKGQNAGEEQGYASEAAMIFDLRKRSHNENPEIAAEAKAIMDELWRKWSIAVKKEYDGKGGKIRIEKGPEQPSLRDITLHGGAAIEKKGVKKRVISNG